MTKLLSILLLAVFSLPLISPLLAYGADADAGLPACCRRNGRHHCSMMVGAQERLAHRGTVIKAAAEQCPYCPGTVTLTHGDRLAAPAAEAVFASLVSHPAGVAQTESRRRIARDRSRQKRGPPTSLSL